MIEDFNKIFILENNILDDVPPEHKANVLAAIAKILEQKRKEKKQRQEIIARTNANDTEEKRIAAMSNNTNEMAVIIENRIANWLTKRKEEQHKRAGAAIHELRKQKEEDLKKVLPKKSGAEHVRYSKESPFRN